MNYGNHNMVVGIWTILIIVNSVGLALVTGLALYITFSQPIQGSEGSKTI